MVETSLSLMLSMLPMRAPVPGLVTRASHSPPQTRSCLSSCKMLARAAELISPQHEPSNAQAKRSQLATHAEQRAHWPHHTGDREGLCSKKEVDNGQRLRRRSPAHVPH